MAASGEPMKVEPTDHIDALGLSDECLDILRQAGVETIGQFIEIKWADVATVCEGTPGKLFAIFKTRDQIRRSLGVPKRKAIPVKLEPARIDAAGETAHSQPPRRLWRTLSYQRAADHPLYKPVTHNDPAPFTAQNNETKIPDRDVHPVQLEFSSVGELPIDFPSSLKLSVRATNILLQMSLKSVADFCAIDEKNLAKRRNCGKKTATEIMDVVRRYKPSCDALPRTPDMLTLTPAQDNTPIAYLRLSFRATNVLARLKISTIGQLTRVTYRELWFARNCGKKTATEIMDAVSRYQTPGMLTLSPAQESIPLTYLRLSFRATNVLDGLKISTIGQLAKVSDQELLNAKNFGRKSLIEARLKLAEFCASGGTPTGRNGQKRLKLSVEPKPFIEELLADLPESEREVMVARFGLWDGRRMTLQDLGDVHGCTRERIRQLETKAVRSLRWPGNMDLVRRFFSRLARKHFRTVFQKGLGLATEDELQSVFMSLFPSPAEGMTAEKFLSQVFFEGASIYEGNCSKIQDGLYASNAAINKRYLNLATPVQECLSHANEPVEISALVSYARRKAKDLQGRILRDFILRCIEASPNIFTDTLGRCGLADRRYMRPKTIKDMIVCALIDMRKPAHYSQVAMRLNEMFPERAPFNPRNIHARLANDQTTFVWQAQGTYGLASWGLKKAPFVKDRLVEIIDTAQQPMSLDQIVPKVLEACRCKKDTVSAILDAHPELFVKFDRGIYGLKQWVT